MSEELNVSSPEHQPALPTPEYHEHPASHAEKAAEAAKTKHEQQRQLTEARQEAHEEAKPDDKTLEKLKAAETASAPAEPQHINRELRKITLRRELQHIRRKLPASQRVLSQVIHQPTVRVISEAAGKTISRPSGLLGGGLVALLGSSTYLYLAEHYSFTYNYFVFLTLFVGGFIIGLALELLVYLATSSRRKIDS